MSPRGSCQAGLSTFPEGPVQRTNELGRGTSSIFHWGEMRPLAPPSAATGSWKAVNVKLCGAESALKQAESQFVCCDSEASMPHHCIVPTPFADELLRASVGDSSASVSRRVRKAARPLRGCPAGLRPPASSSGNSRTFHYSVPCSVWQQVADLLPVFEDRQALCSTSRHLRLVKWQLAPPLVVDERGFCGRRLGNTGACAVASALSRKAACVDLQRLHLCSCAIGDDGAWAIVTALARSPAPLRRLFLEDNEIEDAGARALAAVLGVHKSLKTVDLRMNRLSRAGKMEVRHAVPVGRRIFLDWHVPICLSRCFRECGWRCLGLCPTSSKGNSSCMRTLLTNWLALVLMPCRVPESDVQTYFLACSYAGRYLASTHVSWEELQLVGGACALIALRRGKRVAGSSAERVAAQQRSHTIQRTSRCWTADDMRQKAVEVCEALVFAVDEPTVYDFLRRYFACAGWCTKALFFAEYLLYLAAVDERMWRFAPQTLAASVVTVTRLTLGMQSGIDDGWESPSANRLCVDPWIELAPCSAALLKLHASTPRTLADLADCPNETIVAFEEYSSNRKMHVARTPSAQAGIVPKATASCCWWRGG